LNPNENGKVLLGYNYMIKDKIFPKALDLNENIQINGREFRVAGFLDAIGTPQDDSQIYMTNDAMKSLYGDSLNGYNEAIAKVDVTNIKTVVTNVEENLRKSRDLKKGKEDFFVQSWEDLLATYTGVLNGIIVFIILIAFISVVVSAINTANTMITSVLERRKEIGIMKAVGASNSSVFNIFLFESATLGFIAGTLGVFIGWIFTSGVALLLRTVGWGFLQPEYTWYLFLGLISFATITGAVSGAVPAYRASRISPVTALRYE
jgi:putative ABC transport system permease protein